jgi:ADP-heptose:LPS heptosyltransferase
VNINLLKALDWFGGRLLIRMLPRQKLMPLARTQSFLVIRPGGIGDAVLLIPALISLKKAFPDSIIHVLAEKRNSAAFSLCSCIGRIFEYDTPKDLLNAIRGSYDVVIDTEQWHRLSAAVARLTNAPVLIGFATNERKKMFTHAVPYSMDDYEVYNFLDLMTPLMATMMPKSTSHFVDVPSDLTDKAIGILLPLLSRKIVVIFPGGSIKEKKWGARKYREMAIMLTAKGVGVVVVGGRDDIPAGEQIVTGLHNTLNLCGSLSLAETAAVLERSSLLLTGDSGIMHIGQGLGMKIVALFGPGSAKKWAPRGENCKVINKQLACSPCTTFGLMPKCKKGGACMKDITVEEVFNAAVALLGQ